MPCVSVKHNRARKAMVKATNAEYKSNRKNTKLAKRQQSATLRAARKQQAAAARTAKAAEVATKQAAKTAAKQAAAAARIAKSAKTSAAQTIKTQPATTQPAPVQTSDQVIFKVPHATTSRTPLTSAKSTKSTKGEKDVRGTKSPQTPKPPKVTPLRRAAFMTRGDLINAESRLGSTIFGPVPAGHRREFFHDQENIWIWFECWHDETGHQHQLTVRYEVRTSGVYKKVGAGKYFKLAGDELENFRQATHAYLRIIKKYLYPHATTKA